MKHKFEIGTGVIGGSVKGIVTRTRNDLFEPVYILEGGEVFWESELELDEEYREERLKKLLDE